eukprot:bmy_19331T0
MDQENQTMVTEFYFSDFPHLRKLCVHYCWKFHDLLCCPAGYTFSQSHFFHSLGVTEGQFLAVILIDRYVAICQPLHYATVMTPQLCIQLSTGSGIFGFLVLLPEIVWISTLPFCGLNQIHQLFCDFEPVLCLACADTSMIIITVILRIPSGKSRQKAFSTCAAHITIFFLFFGSVTLMYLRLSVTFPPLLDKDIALIFAVLAPLFNPIIYSLRNKDMKDAIKKIFCSQKMFNVSGSQ